MTDPQNGSEQAAVRGLIQAVSDELGHDVAPEWQDAARSHPRHHFLPERIWLEADGAYSSIGLRDDPEAWFAAAYTDAPVITQINDGSEPDDPAEAWPSSSLSAPSVVFGMLGMLDLRDGMTVLEIGTASGYTAALLCHRLGNDRVVTVELDPVLAGRGEKNLQAAGCSPTVVCGDGLLGHAPAAPYDRVVSTCSVRRVPPEWISQTTPGGVILTPWDNPWICWGLLRLTVGEDGVAVGRFSPHSSFMLARTQRDDVQLFRDVVKDDHWADVSETVLPRRSVVRGDAAFAVGHRIGDIWHAWQDTPVDGVADRLWISSTDRASWAAVDHDGSDDDRFTVRQYGPRRLWDEIEAAYRWWLDHDRPGPERFGLTVTPEGHRAWLDTPTDWWPLPPFMREP
ncbi:methyltransferase domain-containing protein [Kitasatospora sp. HPMI-4]|uniref:methyltransferase domain-containing protein n=1 Tax=Kitasatospora sp. HPMI-4 TaxID=3448443 RepID=UPI003F1B091B